MAKKEQFMIVWDLDAKCIHEDADDAVNEAVDDIKKYNEASPLYVYVVKLVKKVELKKKILKTKL